MGVGRTFFVLFPVCVGKYVEVAREGCKQAGKALCVWEADIPWGMEAYRIHYRVLLVLSDVEGKMSVCAGRPAREYRLGAGCPSTSRAFRAARAHSLSMPNEIYLI